MSSSSSDEDDVITKRIKEAASEELIIHMKQDKEQKDSTLDVKHKNGRKSLRDNCTDESNAQYDIVSTPEFKKHVAKKLSSYLDRCKVWAEPFKYLSSRLSLTCINTLFSTYDTSTLKQRPHDHTDAAKSEGIQLLASSTLRLLGDEEDTVGEKRPKRAPVHRGESSDSSSDEEDKKQRLASVCVTGDSILCNGEGAFKKVVESAGKNDGNISHKMRASSKKKRKKSKENG